MSDPDLLLRQALNLPTDKRAELAARLLRSLDELTDEEAEALWAAKAERRLQDLNRDPTLFTAADEVFRKAENLLG